MSLTIFQFTLHSEMLLMIRFQLFSPSDKYVIRFAVTSQYTVESDIIKDWNEIKNAATVIIREYETENSIITPGERVPGIRVDFRSVLLAKFNFCTFTSYIAGAKKLGTFGTSLLLSNTPMSPKVVNGSFAAIFEKEDSVLNPWTQWLSQLYNETKMSPSKLGWHDQFDTIIPTYRCILSNALNKNINILCKN